MSRKNNNVCILAGVLLISMVLGSTDAQCRSITQATYSSTVVQEIPDNGGFSNALFSTISVPLKSVVEGVEVYLNISMFEWTSDLIVRLTSAGGTRLALAWIGEGGLPITNIIGWYPIDFTPKNDMAQWIGENTEGDWLLECSDHSSGAVGTLNSWQLRITYDDSVPTEAYSWGQVKAMYR